MSQKINSVCFVVVIAGLSSSGCRTSRRQRVGSRDFKKKFAKITPQGTKLCEDLADD